MARYIKDFALNSDPQEIQFVINQYLQSEGYEFKVYDGEQVYTKGTGVLSNPTFFKFSYAVSAMRMETWMKYAILPGVFVGELDTTGFVGSAVKGPWKKRIANIEQMIMIKNNNVNAYAQNNPYNNTPNNIANVNEYAANNTQNMYNYSADAGQPVIQNNFANNFQPEAQPIPPAGVPVSYKEFTEKYAQPSLIKSVKSLCIAFYVFSALTVILSLIFNPLGIIDGAILAGLTAGMQTTKKKVFGILILILSIIETVFSIAAGATPPIWWIVCSIGAIKVLNELDKKYKEFQNRQ